MATTPGTTKPMNKQSLVASISEISGFSKAVSTQVLEEMMRFITKGLKDGNDVSFPGFGTFLVKKRDPREGRNPRTGDTIKIPAKKVPRFRPSPMLKDAIS